MYGYAGVDLASRPAVALSSRAQRVSPGWVMDSWLGAPKRKDHIMATEDKAAHKATEIKGNIKEGVGHATGDDEMEAEGHADQAKGNLKQAGDKVKDAFKK